MTVNFFKAEGFHMHRVEFSDSEISITYTHVADTTPDMAVTKEIHISSTAEDPQLQYWMRELSQAVEELVAHTQRHLRDNI